MRMDKFFIKFLVIVCLVGCISACNSYLNPIPTNTPKPNISITPTNTLIPSSTPTPQPTNTPGLSTISDGTMYYLWGFGSNDPYLIWGAHLRETMNGDCQGFVCNGKDLRLYDSEVWHFLGRGEYGKKVFTFDEPLDTFVITFSGKMGIDALSGTTIDEKTVAYGFLADGRGTTSYMDGSNFPSLTIIAAENKYMPVKTPCGIIDPNPNGDNSYNMSEGSGGIVFNFLDRAWGQKPYLTRKGYSIINLTVVSAPVSIITSEMICP